MALQLIRGEAIVWKSFPGKNYRTFVFISDLAIIIALYFATTKGMVSFIPSLAGSSLLKVLTYVILGSGLLFALFRQINFLLVRYILTTERVLIMTGFISRHMTSVKLENIHDTKVRQSVTDRLIKTGTIYFFTANDSGGGSGDKNHPLHKIPAFKNIDLPFDIHHKVEELLEAAEKR